MNFRLPRQIIAFTIIAIMVAGVIVGCSSNSGGNSSDVTAPENKSGGNSSSTSELEAESNESEEVDLNFPIVDEPITLKYFISMNGAMSATMPTYADVEAFKAIEKLTNIKIEWIHPTGGNEQFALMVSSRDLPDMINWPFGNAKGGAQALLKDNVLIALSEEDLYTYAPNYMRIMDKNPEEKKNTILDDGTMFQFINFNFDPATDEIVYFNIKGPYIRMDWVEKVGLEAPATIDELYEVLKAFKEQDVNGKGNVVPFIVGKSLEAIKAIAGSFGTRWSMHMKDGKIVYGPTTPEFKKYVETMNKWYSEGLINSDFPVLENAGARILSSEAGFTIGSMGSGLTMQREALLESDPNSNLDSLPYLIGPDGHQALVDDKGANPRATAITSANKYPMETLRWIDYAYSPEGSLLTTFGVEGESYEMIDGYPTLTDKVMNPTNGYNQEEAIARYALGPINYPNARDIRFYEQVNLNTPQKKQIQENWSTGTDEILIPPISLTTEESIEYGNIMSSINTYVDEMVLNFIIGKEPLDKFEEFVANIEKMGVEDSIIIYEEALKRFNAR